MKIVLLCITYRGEQMKRIIIILSMFVFLIGTALPFTASAEEQTVYSGKCSVYSDNLTWMLDTVTGELVISGKGKMHDFYYDTALNYTVIPWDEYKSSIKKITVENGVTSINNDGAFSGCTNLESVTFPGTIERIGNSAFSGCTGLSRIELPESLTSIGENAFSSCTGLMSIDFPDSVISVGKSAFSDCTKLEFYEYGNAKYLGTKENSYFYLYEAVNTGITSATIHQSAKIICDYAFSDCIDLTSVNLPDSVTIIGNNAFSNCVTLEFNEYKNAKYLGNSENPYSYLYRVTDKSVTLATMHQSTKIIAESAFSFCGNLTSIEIPVGVTSIGDYAFYYCNALQNITIPRSVTYIGKEIHFGSCCMTGDCQLKVCYCGTEEEWAALVADSAFYYKLLVLHRYDIEEINSPPTHTAWGEKTLTCSLCGDTAIASVAKLTEHTYNTYEKCDITQHKAICECSDYKLEEHGWNDGEITTQPTTEAEGVKIYTCTDCGETRTEVIEKLKVEETTADTTSSQTTSADTTSAETTAGTNAGNESKSGCESYLGGGVSVVLLVSALSAATLRKKKIK